MVDQFENPGREAGGHNSELLARGEPSTPIKLGRLIAYGLPALPLAALQLPFFVIVPTYYSENIGLPLATVGLVLLAIRLFDAVNDPLIGVLSDRFRPRFGRRRFWVAAFAPLTGIAAYMVMIPPPGAGVAYLALWSLLLSIGWSGVLIPYAAWGAELSTDYLGRNRLAAARETLIVVGTMLATATPFIVGQMGFDERSDGLLVIGIFTGLALPLFAWFAVARVPEPVDRSRHRLGIVEGFRQLAANKPFKRLLLAYLLNGLANGLPATLFLIFVSANLGAGGQEGLFLMAYFFFGILGVPFWLWLAKRTSKHRAWCLAMLLAIAAFVWAPFLGPGDLAFYWMIVIATGSALGADLILPSSMQADVIDVDTAQSGDQRSGVYFSAWSLVTKLALALAVGIAFPVIALAGFQTGQAAQPAAALLAVAMLYALVPSLLKLAAVCLMWRFPLTAARQMEIGRTINDRLKQEAVSTSP